MSTNLFQTLQIVTQLRVDTIRQDLRIFAVNNVFLSVQEPSRNLELRRVLDNRHNSLQLVRVEFPSTATPF